MYRPPSRRQTAFVITDDLVGTLLVTPRQLSATQADQVNQLVTASEADPDLGFMARLMALLLPAPHQPRQPDSVYPAKRPVHLSHDCRW